MILTMNVILKITILGNIQASCRHFLKFKKHMFVLKNEFVIYWVCLYGGILHTFPTKF